MYFMLQKVSVFFQKETFMLFVLLFHIKFTGILYVHGTSKAFYTANEF